MPQTGWSVWESETLLRADWLVAGAGLVGLSTALHLRQHYPNDRVVVVDQALPGLGASTRNAGFACLGSPTELLEDIEMFGLDTALQTLELRFRGLQLLESLLGNDALGMQQAGGYELLKEPLAQEQLDYLNAVCRPVLGFDICQVVPRRDTRFAPTMQPHHWVHMPREAALDTGLMMLNFRKLVQDKGIELWAPVRLLGYESGPEGCTATLEHLPSLQLKGIALCVNAYINQLHPQAAQKPGRNLVWLTAPLAHRIGPAHAVYHAERGYYYFRQFADRRLLVGGGRHLDPDTEASLDLNTSATNPIIAEGLDRFIRQHILGSEVYSVEQSWMGVMSFGDSKSPVIEQLKPGVWAAYRCGGMGVAMGALTGQRMAAQMAGIAKQF